MPQTRLPPNQRLRLALPPIGERPFAVLRLNIVVAGDIMLTAFGRLTPALRWGAAETHDLWVDAL